MTIANQCGRLQGITKLLNKCHKLTHLSLTGIETFFLDENLKKFCRDPPEGLFLIPGLAVFLAVL